MEQVLISHCALALGLFAVLGGVAGFKAGVTTPTFLPFQPGSRASL